MTAGGSSIPEVQRLLAVLAAGRRCAEIGTAFGFGAAAIASTAASLVTCELDPVRAAEAKERLSGFDNVELLVGNWRELIWQHTPFQLVFLDGGKAKDDPTVIDLVEPGGLFVLDDFMPGREGPDLRRELWLGGLLPVVSTEIMTTPTTSAIVAARRP